MRKRTSLAQTLVLDPDIILMDEPFSALDIQTRQLMENEVLELWAAKKKAVLFITHDLDEAIAMSDRVVVLSAGPASHPIGEFVIDLPRPRDVAEVRVTPRFVELHKAIWDVLRDEVLKGYAQQKLRCADSHVERYQTQSENAAHCGRRCVLVAVFVFWYAMTTPGLIPPIMFENDRQAAFFFGEPLKIFAAHLGPGSSPIAISTQHLWVTLLETLLAFAIGTIGGLIVGLWLALSPMAGAIFDPYIKALNSMPRVILAPIFAVWFGLGIASQGGARRARSCSSSCSSTSTRA